MLHSGMSSLLTDLMQNFVNKKSLYDVTDVVQALKPVYSLVQLNLNKKESLKPKSFIDVGTHAKLLLEGIADDEKVKGFRSSCLKSYVAANTYLQQNLPFSNKIIEYAQYLRPQKRNHFSAKSGISNLTFKLAKVFGKKSQAVFKTSATPNEIVNLVRSQWSIYQIEEILPSMYLAQNGSSKRENHYQNSYCKYALDYCSLFVDKDRPKSKYFRVNTYWHAVGQMTNEDSVLKYPQLFTLAKIILSVSHGNVVPEGQREGSQSTDTSF